MRRIAIILSLAAVALLCCQCAKSPYQLAKKGAKSVPFTTLEHYYVRNNAASNHVQRLILDTKEDFEAYFGEGAVMGGMPTDINWRRQYVIALLLPVVFGILWANGQSPLPIGILLLIAGVPVIVIICIVAVLIQRIKEIKGGEEDEAAQY